MGAHKYFAGKQRAGIHGSLTHTAERVVAVLKKLSVRIGPGYITCGSTRVRKVIIHESRISTLNFLLLSVVGDGAKQDIKIFTTDPVLIQGALEPLKKEGFEIVVR